MKSTNVELTFASIQVHEDDSLNQAGSPEASESGWMQNGVKEKPSRFAGWVPRFVA